MAEFERDLIRERPNAGLAAAKAEGRVGGRRRVLSDDDLKLARTLMKDRAWTRDAIASKLGVSHMTIYRELKRSRAESDRLAEIKTTAAQAAKREGRPAPKQAKPKPQRSGAQS